LGRVRPKEKEEEIGESTQRGPSSEIVVEEKGKARTFG